MIKSSPEKNEIVKNAIQFLVNQFINNGNIEDKDLWKWKMEYSQEINFALQDHLNLKEFTLFLEEETNSFQKLLQEGKIVKKENLR